MLAEALRVNGLTEQAQRLEAQLLAAGAMADRRTFALFLSTRGLQPATAVDLAERELQERADVHTHDALAWALAAAGRWSEAAAHTQQALALGTEDPRLYFHAGIIFSKLGQAAEATRHLDHARSLAHMLLPSERDQLSSARQRLASSRGPGFALRAAPRQAWSTT